MCQASLNREKEGIGFGLQHGGTFRAVLINCRKKAMFTLHSKGDYVLLYSLLRECKEN